MSSHSHINLRDVEDSVGGRLEGLEGRFGRKHLGSRDLGISLWTYAAGVRGGAHSHREQEEAYVVVSGSGRVRVGDSVLEVRQWDVVRVAPEAIRQFEAGPDGLEMIAVGGPKPEGGDGVRSDEPWPGE
jgi:quercetin dioxygenase-like cupin family protein